MAKTPIIMIIRFAWWVELYIYGLQTFCMITGLSPDMDKVKKTLSRGMRIERQR